MVPTQAVADSLEPVKVQVFRLQGQPCGGWWRPAGHTGPFQVTLRHQVCFGRPASSQRPAPSPVRVLWVFTPCCPHRAGGEGITAHLTLTTQAFTCQMGISRELWDSFSRSVFTGEVTAGRGGRRGGRDEGGTRGQPCSCSGRGGRLPGPAGRAAGQGAAHGALLPPGAALPPCARRAPTRPRVTEHVRGTCLNSGVP